MKSGTSAFFGRIYAPELLMGLPSADEVRDISVLSEQPDGTYAEDARAEPPASTIVAPQSKSARAAAAADAAAVKTQATATEQREPPATSTPAQTAAQAADPATGELPPAERISASQVKYLLNKISAIELPDSAVNAILVRMGVKSLDLLDANQFDTLKAELLAMGA